METWRNTICQDKESNRCHEQDAERADLVTWNMVLSATPWEKLGFKVWVCKICLEGPQIFISCLRISDSTLGGLQIANSLWRQSMDMVWCIICIGIDVYVYLHVSMYIFCMCIFNLKLLHHLWSVFWSFLFDFSVILMKIRSKTL